MKEIELIEAIIPLFENATRQLFICNVAAHTHAKLTDNEPEYTKIHSWFSYLEKHVPSLAEAIFAHGRKLDDDYKAGDAWESHVGYEKPDYRPIDNKYKLNWLKERLAQLKNG